MTAANIERLAQWISETHAKHRDGCKSSCGHREIGYHSADYDESYWYCRFGGYCFGSLSRNTEIRASNTIELEIKVRETIEKAIAEDLAGVEDYPTNEGG